MPPESGGTLQVAGRSTAARSGSGYDAWLDACWACFAPRTSFRARHTHPAGAVSEPARFGLPPAGPSSPSIRQQPRRFRVRSDERRFVQPSGWIVMGDLGVRRDDIAGIRVAIAAPGRPERATDRHAGAPQLDLPGLVRLVPDAAVPPHDRRRRRSHVARRLVGPSSIYLHCGRPLISENGTSTLLHEVMHVLMSAQRTRARLDRRGLRGVLLPGVLAPKRIADTGASFTSARRNCRTGPERQRCFAVANRRDRRPPWR